MAAAGPAVGDLIDVPDDISVSYFPDSVAVSRKCQEKALNYYTEGYVHDIKVRVINEKDKALSIDGKCWRSMKKNEKPHTLHIKLLDKKITESICSCKAG